MSRCQRAILTFLAAVCLSFGLSNVATGQGFFNPDPKAAYSPRIDSTSFNRIIEKMSISDDGKGILLALRGDLIQFYSTQGAAAEKRIAESLEAMQAYSREHRVHPLNAIGHDFDYTKNLTDWHLNRQHREEQFNHDVAAVLTIEKHEQWFDVVWQNRRQRTLFDLNVYLGSDSPVPVLPEIVAGMSHAEAVASSLDSAIREHLRELDQRLRDWERGLIDGLLKQHELAERLFRGQVSQERVNRESPDMSAGARDIRKWVINDAMNMAPLLPDDLQREFRRAIAAAADPAIYHRSPVDGVIEQLRRSDRLDDARRRALESIEADYESRLAPMRRRMVAANEHWQDPANQAERWQRKQAMREADPSSDPWTVVDGEHEILKLLPDRRRLEFDTLRAIHRLFTPDELKSLPPGARYLLQFGADAER